MEKIILFLLLVSANFAQSPLLTLFDNNDSATTQATGGITPLYTLDFEENNLAEWSSTSGANLSASNTFAHTGTYSMRVGTNSFGSYDFTAIGDAYATFWIYLPSTSSHNASYHYIASFNEGLAGDRSYFGTNQNPYSEWIAGPNSGTMTAGLTTNFSTNAWHKVKIRYQTNGTTTSTHQIWVDDTSIFSTTAAYTDQGSRFRVGSQSATMTGYFYIDDIKIYSSDPGTQD